MRLGDLNINGAVGEDMSVPTCPRDFIDGYALSKARGEKVVLAANDHGRLSTVCLRPAIIYSSDDGKLAEALLKG